MAELHYKILKGFAEGLMTGMISIVLQQAFDSKDLGFFVQVDFSYQSKQLCFLCGKF